MTETTERFLQEIAAHVGHDRVAELYLFPVLRQGGVEGAVAVVAAYPERDLDGEATPTSAPDDAPPSGSADEEPAGDEAVVSDGMETGPGSDGSTAPSAAEEQPAEPAQPASEQDDAVRGTRAEGREARPRTRHVVYTARYRHTVKGTDRGRWAVEIVAEADAPLITVEEVVRGVVRRSGDAFQPERISGEQFRALVPAPAAP